MDFPELAASQGLPWVHVLLRSVFKKPHVLEPSLS